MSGGCRGEDRGTGETGRKKKQARHHPKKDLRHFHRAGTNLPSWRNKCTTQHGEKSPASAARKKKGRSDSKGNQLRYCNKRGRRRNASPQEKKKKFLKKAALRPIGNGTCVLPKSMEDDLEQVEKEDKQRDIW